jgi:hypothetical protein
MTHKQEEKNNDKELNCVEKERKMWRLMKLFSSTRVNLGTLIGWADLGLASKDLISLRCGSNRVA